MKILVTGGSGRIGYEFFEHLANARNDVICTFLKHQLDIPKARKADLTNKENVMSLIGNEKPDIVIHTAALTNVDLCETDRKLADLQNVEVTKNVIDACIKTRSKIIFLSSPFVYSGRKNLYTEDDKTDPINYYGITKAKSEKHVVDSGLDYLIIRTDQPYNWIKPWQSDNQVTKVLKNLEKGKSYDDLTDWHNTPTFIPDIVNATLRLIQNDKIGIYNIVGPDYISRYNWSLTIADVFGKDSNLIKPINSHKLNLTAKRPNANLSNKKAEADSRMVFVGVREGLEIMKRGSSGKDL